MSVHWKKYSQTFPFLLLLLSSSSSSTITNLVTYLDFITPLVSSQGQADAIYIDLSSVFDHVPHILLLQNLSAFGLSGGYVNWFCSY
jgi:hypothetical protein